MEAERSSRIVELKRQVSLLRKDELRLRWIITSEFVTEKLKAQADGDLKSLLKNLRAAEIELSRLEND